MSQENDFPWVLPKAWIPIVARLQPGPDLPWVLYMIRKEGSRTHYLRMIEALGLTQREASKLVLENVNVREQHTRIQAAQNFQIGNISQPPSQASVWFQPESVKS